MKIYRLVFVACAGLAFASAGCGSGDSAAPAPPSSAPVATQVQSEPASTSPVACGVDLAAPAVVAAIATLPPDPITKAGWSTNPAGFYGTFDPCVTLSTVIITIERATGSSPDQALLFHQGEFVGTATPESHGFTSLDPERTNDDTVGLSYQTPGSCNACPPASVTNVQFHWDGKQVRMIGTPPK